MKYTEEKETLVVDDDPQSSGVKFSIGFMEDDEDPEEEKEHHKERGHRRASHHIKKISKTEKQFANEDAKRKKSKEATSLADESGNLQEVDLEEIEGHRFEKSVPKYSHSHNKKVLKIGRDDMEMGERTFGYGHRTDIDHTAHPLFIEMDELEGEEWQERARWIKYEEDLEAEKGEWGKPHVSSLTFHSMINLRINIETGTMMLDISVKDFPNLVHRVVEDLSEKGIIEEHMKEKILRVLLFRHKHVHPHEKTFKLGLGLRRSMSQRSMQVIMTGHAIPSKTFIVSVWTLDLALNWKITIEKCWLSLQQFSRLNVGHCIRPKFRNISVPARIDECKVPSQLSRWHCVGGIA